MTDCHQTFSTNRPLPSSKRWTVITTIWSTYANDVMQVGKHEATHANKCKKTCKTMICSHIFANFARYFIFDKIKGYTDFNESIFHKNNNIQRVGCVITYLLFEEWSGDILTPLIYIIYDLIENWKRVLFLFHLIYQVL